MVNIVNDNYDNPFIKSDVEEKKELVNEDIEKNNNSDLILFTDEEKDKLNKTIEENKNNDTEIKEIKGRFYNFKFEIFEVRNDYEFFYHKFDSKTLDEDFKRIIPDMDDLSNCFNFENLMGNYDNTKEYGFYISNNIKNIIADKYKSETLIDNFVIY